MFRLVFFSQTIVLLIAVVSAVPAYPHGGGLDANGGHYNRKTGEYHSHRSPSTPPSSSSRNSLFSPAPTPQIENKPVPMKPTPPPEPRGRVWFGSDGKRLAKGDPSDFNEVSCSITINDGVQPEQTISLESLSVLDQAFALDGLKARSQYNGRLLKWTSKSGVHKLRATPLVAESDSIRLLKSDGRVIDVKLSQLDATSQQLALELHQAGEKAKELIKAREPDPFEGGSPTEPGPFETATQ